MGPSSLLRSSSPPLVSVSSMVGFGFLCVLSGLCVRRSESNRMDKAKGGLSPHPPDGRGHSEMNSGVVPVSSQWKTATLRGWLNFGRPA